jgi:O-antigen/teichoic acid export membrane protein
MVSEVKEYYKKIISSNYILKNVSFLILGTLFAQGIQVLATPYLARIYSPQIFGIFSIYFSIVSLISVFITGRYEYSILVYKNSRKAYNAFYLTIFVIFSLSLVLLLIYRLLTTSDYVNSYFQSVQNYKIIEPFIIPIALNTLFIGIYQSLIFLLNYENDYRSLSKSRIVLSIVTILIQIVFSELSIWGLIIGNIIGYIVSDFVLILIIKIKFHFKGVNTEDIVFIARENKELPFVNGTHSMINILKDNYINFFLYSTYSNVILGNYYLMFRIIKIPVSLIGSSISQVLIRELSINSNDFMLVLRKVLLALIVIGFFPTFILFFWGEDIFIFVFGEKWRIAGKMAEALSIYMFSHFLASPLTGIPIILKMQKVGLIWGFIESLLFVSIFFISNLINVELLSTLFILSIAFLIYFFLYIVWIFNISSKFSV